MRTSIRSCAILWPSQAMQLDELDAAIARWKARRAVRDAERDPACDFCGAEHPSRVADHWMCDDCLYDSRFIEALREFNRTSL